MPVLTMVSRRIRPRIGSDSLRRPAATASAPSEPIAAASVGVATPM